MSSLGNISVRSTAMLVSDRLLASLRQTQAGLLEAQEQISTGLEVRKPSDAPSKAAAILTVQGRLEARDQQDRNLDHALGVLNNLDESLRDATDKVIEATGIASSQIGIGSSTDTRKNQSTVIQASVQTLLDLANRQYEGVSLFGGEFNPKDAGQVFTDFLGGVRYHGTGANLGVDAGLDEPLAFNSNGAEAFGALSARVTGKDTFQVLAGAGTRLADASGAQGAGVRRGPVTLTVDGTDVTVDLADADTLGDVATRVNAAVASVAAGVGSLAVAGQGFRLTAAAGHTIQIADPDGGQTAADLGIALAASGSTVAGGSVAPRLTLDSPIAALGAGIDWASGLRITQGTHAKTVSFAGAQTVEDLVHAVDKADLGVRLEINAAGNGLDLVDEVSGLELSVGENGGTTAADLGLRTFDLSTTLASLGHGRGVSNAQGQADFALHLHNGANFSVNLDGVTDVAGVVARITAAAQGAGLTAGAPGATGTGLNIGLAPTGNGLVIEDGTAGGGEFRVEQLGTSLAAEDLGINQDAGAGSSIAGKDVAKVQVESVFSHMIALRDALGGDDSRGITLAGSALETDADSLARTRADAGVRSQRVQQQQQRSAEMKLAEQSLLSGLRDADVTSVITRFTQLQQQLQASMQAGAQNLHLSFLDYLR